jgi:anthranilate synthase component 1
MEASKIDIVPSGLPPMSSSGLFGMIGYDMVRLIEDIPNDNPDMLDIPDALMMRPTIMVIFDNVKQIMCVATPVRASDDEDAQTVYSAAKIRLGNITKQLADNIPQPYQAKESKPTEAKALTSQAEYEDTVRKAKEYITAGDIFQVVPSVRFEMDFNLEPFEFYRSLRRLNPSPFLFHLKLGEFALTGSSPEILVRVRDETVTIRPIAGTRKRGKDDTEDNALAKELLNDAKECAEHLMLLDLGRNDVGRVSEIGSINVTEKFIIEKYSHVMHIVSNVQGKLRKDLKPLDALFSGFPAGTVSGAPKIRAMQIIDELEPYKRSFYAGCIGYFDGHGDVDSCIALRTAMHKDGKLYIQAGAGVVADSDPTAEYQECCNKAKALIEAAQLAQSGQISTDA